MSSRSKMNRRVHHKSTSGSSLVRRKGWGRNLRMETMEPRHLLSGSSPGFLQGIAFYDTNGNNRYDVGEAPKVGATIELHDSAGVFIRSTTTNSNGYYQFTGLSVDPIGTTYQLVEPSTAAYSSHGTQILSQLDSASALSNNTIKVTLVDPNSVQALVNFTPDNVIYKDLSLSVFGNTQEHAVGEDAISLTSSAGATPTFYSFCMDIFQDLNFGANSFPVLPSPNPSGTGLPHNFDKIAYLYNHYGTAAYGVAQPLTANNAAALQLAMWELLYDSGSPVDAFTTGNISNVAGIFATSAADVTAILDQATSYLQDAQGKSECAIYLDASLGGTIPDSQPGRQSFITTESYNFANSYVPAINTMAGGTVVIGSGAKLTDTAMLSGGFNPTGTITFTLYSPSNVALYTDVVTVNGSGTYNTSVGTNPGGYLPSATGTYLWKATYSGDTNNTGASDNGQNESEAVTPTNPAINTMQLPSSATVGAAITDKATITGLVNASAGDTVTFNLYNNPNGTGSPLFTDTETVTLGSGGTATATSASFTTTAASTLYWVAMFNGDTNNSTATSGTSDEPVTVSSASPTLITTASLSAGNVVGSAIPQDKAVLSGGYHESGAITFTLTAPNNTVVDTETITANGDGTYTTSNANVATQVGTYTWTVSYAGDSLNNGAVDQGGAAEKVTTTKASPMIVTAASFKAGSGVVVGSAIPEDSAVVSGGYKESGILTFKLYAPDNTVVDTENIPLTGPGNGTYTTTNTVAATQIGTYTWKVSYAGDSLNNGAVDQGGAAEQVTTTKASPTLITTASLKAGCTYVVNNAIPEDSAVLSGGVNETGTLTFKLYAPNNTVVDTENVIVQGNGTYTTANIVAATQVGTYTWKVSYSGDTFNNGAVDQGGAAEQVTVISPPITITGTKFNDLTGNGFSTDDTGLGGVTIALYKESNGTSGLQTGSGGDTLVTTTTTSSNGTYSFGNISVPATYYVQEIVPALSVQTGGGPCGPAGNSYYTIAAQSGQTYANNKFDDYDTSDCADVEDEITNISYLINGCTTLSTLRGMTHQGDEVQVTFTVAPGTPPHQLTLVSYTAPGSAFDANVASQQQVFDYDTGVFGPGTYTLEVRIPNSFYQIDFVCGSLIDHFGPANSNIFYTSQGRLITADNSGTSPVLSNGSSLTGTVFVDGNKNGLHDAGEVGVGLVKITLTSTDGQNIVQYTKSDGTYLFSNLKSGKYTIAETSPSGFTDGQDILGSLGGTLGNDVISAITVGTGVNGTGYDFGEKITKLGTNYSVAYQTDSMDSTKSDLVINGTSGIDVITVTYSNSKYNVTLNGTLLGSYANKDATNHSVARLVVCGGAGNDDIAIDSTVTIVSELYGGEGNDRLMGGGGNNILVGGNGADTIIGNGLADLIIGGNGSDTISGGGGDDLMIAGSTTYDSTPSALRSVFAEWISARDYTTRVNNLLGVGSGTRLNGTYFLNASNVFDDGEIDRITGGTGGATNHDWFLANAGITAHDLITDLAIDELVTDI
jgi:Ca2+-binding RTX toxin-like protein